MRTVNAQAVISIMVVVTFGTLMFLLILRPVAIDASLKEVLLILVGVLASKFGSVVDYYMGSSAGSKHANETLSQIATTGTGS